MASSLIDRNATVPLMSKSLSSLMAALESSEDWKRLTSLASANLKDVSVIQEASLALLDPELIERISKVVGELTPVIETVRAGDAGIG